MTWQMAELIREDEFKVEIVKSWQEDPIEELYRAGGWWKKGMDKHRLNELIQSSFLFAVAIDISIRKTVGMGRVISDGISDAYFQDIVVLPEFRGRGVGRMILEALLGECLARKISWIALIAEPKTADFYSSLGFTPVIGYVPMLYTAQARSSGTSQAGESPASGSSETSDSSEEIKRC
jgi:GNAT superfamily N-acetyltransferase